jgi:hypothetical protein
MGERMRATLYKLSMLTLLGAVAVLGCNNNDEADGPSANCSTTVDNVTSPSSGFAMLHGSFYSNETVIIQESDGTEIAHGTPDSDRSTFTLSGVPSGTHRYRIIVSCDAGQEDLGTYDFVVQ